MIPVRCGGKGDVADERARPLGDVQPDLHQLVAAAGQLEEKGIGADVVSMPCTERFDAQPDDYREHVLPDVSNRDILRVSVEAGTTFGWERYVGDEGTAIGFNHFGASAPYETIYKEFGLTAAAMGLGMPAIAEFSILAVAGTVWAEKDGRTWGKGATGYGVRLLDRYVRDVLEA